MKIPCTYPLDPPALRFLNPQTIFHPNVDRVGNCVAGAWGWRQGMGLVDVLKGLQGMLQEPKLKWSVHPEAPTMQPCSHARMCVPMLFRCVCCTHTAACPHHTHG